MDVHIDGLAWLPKDELGLDSQRRLKQALTILPKRPKDIPGDDAAPLLLYEETESHLGVPRGFFDVYSKASHSISLDLTSGSEVVPVSFKGTLRGEQAEALALVTSKLSGEYAGGILQAKPGWGKTCTALAIVAALRVPALVLVHKNFLTKQWTERIEEFLPGAKVGIAQQDRCDYEGCHVVVAMQHSLAAREYPADFYRHFGLIITDECHRIGSRTWAPLQGLFPARWRLGLTATPRRSDGCERAFLYHIGPVMMEASEQRLTPLIKRVWTDFKFTASARFNPNLVSRPIQLNILCKNQSRNRAIAKLIAEAASKGRKVLVISERIKHLQELEQLTTAEAHILGTMPEMDYYIGGRTDDQYAAAAKANILFATKQYVSEGFDLPALDTLFLCTPLYDVEQIVGRILRPHPDKKEPMVVDIRDDKVAKFKHLGTKRDEYYDSIT